MRGVFLPPFSFNKKRPAPRALFVCQLRIKHLLEKQSTSVPSIRSLGVEHQ